MQVVINAVAQGNSPKHAGLICVKIPASNFSWLGFLRIEQASYSGTVATNSFRRQFESTGCGVAKSECCIAKQLERQAAPRQPRVRFLIPQMHESNTLYCTQLRRDTQQQENHSRKNSTCIVRKYETQNKLLRCRDFWIVICNFIFSLPPLPRLSARQTFRK